MNVIVGGGLMGSALALELARRGREVIVLEKAVVGAEASSAAAGILAPRIEAHGDPALRAIGLASLALYPEWLASLGDPVELRLDGLLRVVHAGETLPEPDPDAVWLAAGEARAREPGLSDRIEGAWLLEGEGRVDTRSLVQAVKHAAQALGVRFHERAEVTEVRPHGVSLPTGRLEGGEVVVCAGAWTAKVPGLPPLPIRPVRGQVVALRASGVVRHVLFGGGGYIVPRSDEIVVGSTMEEVGYQKGLTPNGLRHVFEVASRNVPVLGELPFDRAWSSFRPGSPDGLPLLGKVDGVWIASGHFRNGILLAPFTARAMADAILDGKALPEACRPDRFAAG